MQGAASIEAPKPHISARAYLAILGGACFLFCSVGFINAYGVFQGFYREDILRNYSNFDISWIGSIAIFLLYLAAPVSGILVDKIGPKLMIIGGSLGLLIGVFMTSLCKQYYQFFLAQGVLVGISMGFIVWPPVAVVSRHVPHRRGLALGIVIGGSSLGGVIWPIMIEKLLTTDQLGFPWTMRVVGFTMLPLLAIGCLCITEPPRPANKSSSSSDSSADKEALDIPVAPPTPAPAPSLFKNPVYVSLCLSLALGFLGMFIPFFYIPTYASGHGASPTLSIYMISILNAASLFGRIVPGHLADTMGHYNLMVLALGFSGITAFAWTAVHNVAGLVVWSAAFGFSSGAMISLQAACAGKIATPQTQGRAIGFLQGCLAVTVLVGSPIAGQLIEHYGFLATSMFAGSTLFAGCLIMVYARYRLDSRLAANV